MYHLLPCPSTHLNSVIVALLFSKSFPPFHTKTAEANAKRAAEAEANKAAAAEKKAAAAAAKKAAPAESADDKKAAAGMK